MTRVCIAQFSEYHKTTLKTVAFKPGDASNPLRVRKGNVDVLSTSSRDGSVFVWDLRCTGVPSQNGPKYKPMQRILNAHAERRGRTVSSNAVTAMTWAGSNIVTACDKNSYSRDRFVIDLRVIKVWDLRNLYSKFTVPAESSSGELPSTGTRPFGITSLVHEKSTVYALSKDSRYPPPFPASLTKSLLLQHRTPPLRSHTHIPPPLPKMRHLLDKTLPTPRRGTPLHGKFHRRPAPRVLGPGTLGQEAWRQGAEGGTFAGGEWCGGGNDGGGG
jgi:hypothetical protein